MPVTIPPIVSVDDHVVEPQDLFQRWLPHRYRDRAPHVIRAPYRGQLPAEPLVISDEGPETDFWVYEDRATPVLLSLASAGLPLEEVVSGPITYDRMRPGCYDPTERLRDMDANHIERSLCFPMFPRFCGQTFLDASDKELALACVEAYNDWMVDEWCGDSGGRLIPLCLVPLWDPRQAATEIRRNSARGVHAVSFSELPTNLGLPSIHDRDHYWDPVFRACDETGTVICIHIGSGSKFTTTSPDAPSTVYMALTSLNSMASLADWLFSGVLARFPNIKLAFSESQIGWMPYMFERMDAIWSKGSGITNKAIDPAMTAPPSSYVAGRVFGCFFDDDFGLKSRESIGVDQITFESDYPHQDSTWPNTKAYAEKAMADLPQEHVDKICRGNALAMLDLD